MSRYGPRSQRFCEAQQRRRKREWQVRCENPLAWYDEQVRLAFERYKNLCWQRRRWKRNEAELARQWARELRLETREEMKNASGHNRRDHPRTSTLTHTNNR